MVEKVASALKAPVVCAGCGKVYHRKSYEHPHGWLRIVATGSRYEPFYEVNVCSSGCLNAAIEKIRRFCSLHLA